MIKTKLPLLEKEIDGDGKLVVNKSEIEIGIDTSLFAEERWESNFPAQAKTETLFAYIKEVLHVKYYVRYVDDMVLIDSNKRKLHKAVAAIDNYLHGIGLKIKGNWQVWKLNSRPIDFVGYRFYKNKTILRKRIFFRLCRRVRKVSKTGYTTPRQAMSLLSLIGWLSHINGRNFYKKNIYPYAPKNKLKKIVSNYSKQNGGNLKNGKRKTKSIQQRQMARNGKRGQGGGDTNSTRN